MQDEAKEQVVGPPAWAMPVAAIATVLGFAALFAGLFAFASGADTSRFASDPEVDFFDPLGSSSNGASSGGSGGAEGPEPSSPFDQGNDSSADSSSLAQGAPSPGGAGVNPEQGVPLQDGQVLPPGALRDLAQRQLDQRDGVSLDVSGQQIDVTRHSNGVIELKGPSGNPMFIAPDGVPGSAASPDQAGNLLAPSVGGPYSGVRIDENGDVVPVPIGEETAGTMRFGFADDGARSLTLPGTGEALRITPEGRDAFGGPTPDFGGDASGDGFGIRPDVRRDAIQSELDWLGSTRFSVDGEPVTVTRLPNGALRVRGPNGESILLLPDGVTTGLQGSDDPGASVFAPSPDGRYSGLRVDETGQLVPVEKGDEADDTLLFGFGPDLVRELFLPEADGQALRISPDGETSLEPPPGASQPPDTQSPEDPASDFAADDQGRGVNWRPILLALGVAALVLAAMCIAIYFNKRNRPAAPEDQLDGNEVDENYDLLDAVSSMSRQIEVEPDPRVSILRAYAQVESGFASDRLVRQRSESPKQFLERAFGDTPGAHEPLLRLTGLFELARFSDYPITAAMRDDALQALQQIRMAFTAPGTAAPPGGPGQAPPPPDPSALVSR